MKSQSPIPAEIFKLLKCPACQGELKIKNKTLVCVKEKIKYPIINGVPILIDEKKSIFTISQIKKKQSYYNLQKSKLTELARKILPDISKNYVAPKNYRLLAQKLLQKNKNPKVLVLGSGKRSGAGMEIFNDYPKINFIESDIGLTGRVDLVLDAHRLPLKNNSFDAVIAQAVLEHLIDPYQAVSEIYRVLKKDGYVYAETPFMQQVHAGAFDFTRFTQLGHRRLFRNFNEIASGVATGPGMAFAWSYQYFLLSFFKNKFLRLGAMLFARLTSFFWKYFDLYLNKKRGSLDAAAGYYFWGKKSKQVLSDKELIKEYEGLI